MPELASSVAEAIFETVWVILVSFVSFLKHELVNLLLASVAADEEMLKMLQFVCWNNRSLSQWVCR